MKLKKWYEALRDRIVRVGFFKKLYAVPFIHKLLEYEIVSYLVFGVLTTLVNFTVCWLMNRLPAVIHPGTDYETYVLFSVGKLPILWTYLTNTVGWTAAVLFAFITNKLFVFESKDRSAGTLTRELTTFIGARVLSLLLFELLLFAGLQRLLGHFWIPKILSAVANVVFNYVASKLVIFRKKEETGEPSC